MYPTKLLLLTLFSILLVGCGGGSSGKASGSSGPVTVIPVADAGDDFLAFAGDTITLNGSGSTGNSLDFSWQQLTGRPVDLINPTSETPSFVSQEIIGVEQLEFQLIVTDSAGNTTSDMVLVRIEPENTSTTVTRISVNDTGQLQGTNYPSGINSDCTGETVSLQDCFTGRDVEHPSSLDGHGGFSFTKLDSSGLELDATSLIWSCTRDNVTGLTWEIKKETSGPRSNDLRYRWGGQGATVYGTEFYDDWNSLIESANSDLLCGYDDWRVPTIKELQSIIVYDRYHAVDHQFFIYDTGCCWSSSALYYHNESVAEVILLGSGDISSSSRHSKRSVWLVRGPKWQ